MKVAFLTTNLDPFAGWGRYSREIVQRLPALGVQPIVLVERGSKPVALDGVEVHAVLHPYRQILRNPLLAVRDAVAARKLVAGARFVHCLAEPHLMTASLLHRPARPLLTTAVGTYAASVLKGRAGALFRLAYRPAIKIPSISAYTGKRLAATLPAVRDRLVTIPLGVTPPAVATAVRPAAAREPAFLAVGAVKRRKGTHLIIEALGVLAPRFPQARVYLVGDTRDQAYVAEVKARVAALGLEANVAWLGKVPMEELDDLYRRVRGLVMPSLNHGKHFEGFGLVHLEANALGVPAIGSRDCGNEDAIRDGHSGFLVEQGNVSQLAHAMGELLDSDAAWDRMSENAVDFARSMSWDRTARAYADLYRN